MKIKGNFIALVLAVVMAGTVLVASQPVSALEMLEAQSLGGLFGESGSTAHWNFDGSTITITGGTAINPSGSINLRDHVSDVTTINIVGDITAIGDMSGVFGDIYNNLTAINGIERINTSGVTDMSWLFTFVESLRELDLSTWDTRAVTDMSMMFGHPALAQARSLQSIRFGRNFVSVDPNSLPHNNWRNLRTNDVKNSEQLWDYLRTATAREHDDTWQWAHLPFPTPTPATPTPTPTPGAPLPTPPPPPGEFNHGDVNGDGVIDIRDVTMLRLYLVGRINQLGPAQ